MSDATIRRSGPPDAQALIVRARAWRAIATMIYERGQQMAIRTGNSKAGDSHASPRAWLPSGSEVDPRLYHVDTHVVMKRPSKPAISNLADHLSSRVGAAESASLWRRDLAGWLQKKRAISPEKLRRLAEALDASWIRAFIEAGYLQHLVYIIDDLVCRAQFDSANVVAAAAFPVWSNADLAALYLLEPGGFIDLAIRKVEATEPFDVIPARVSANDINDQTIRVIFRALEPADYVHLSDGVFSYPSAPAQKATLFLLSQLLPTADKSFDAEALVRRLVALLEIDATTIPSFYTVYGSGTGSQ